MRTLKEFNDKFVANLQQIGEIQNKLNDEFNLLGREIKALKQVQQEMMEDRTKFIKVDNISKKDLDNLDLKIKEVCKTFRKNHKQKQDLEPAQEIMEFEI